MPMAGDGTRFANAGYQPPKPLIPVNGKPMFQHVVENIGLDFDEKIFIVQKRHKLRDCVLSIYPDAHVIELDGPTDGAASTILTAREFYEDGSSIFVANCDQHVEWNKQAFLDVHNTSDGTIAVFDAPDRDAKWSYAEVDGNRAKRVAEKDPISDLATVGFYSWKDGRKFISSAADMMAKNDRVNGEFYLCPVFNYSIADGEDIRVYHVDSMQGLGTPEDYMNWEHEL